MGVVSWPCVLALCLWWGCAGQAHAWNVSVVACRKDPSQGRAVELGYGSGEFLRVFSDVFVMSDGSQLSLVPGRQGAGLVSLLPLRNAQSMLQSAGVLVDDEAGSIHVCEGKLYPPRQLPSA